MSLKKRQREWAATHTQDDTYDYLRTTVADILVDRLDDILRDFEVALDLGCHKGHIYDAMVKQNEYAVERGIGGVKHLAQTDIADFKSFIDAKTKPKADLFSSDFVVSSECADSQVLSPEKYDLVMSSLYLHWVNDLPSMLKQIKTSLKPDGAFLGTMLGGSTLEEFRNAFFMAEMERTGGVAPHASPLARASDMAALMQAAGFNLPTIDVDTITVSYPNAFVLMEHLVGMGEGSAAYDRQAYPAGRDTFLAMATLYQDMYGNEDGEVNATFQVISMIGWKPHESQQQPLKRGSATRSLKEIGNDVVIDKSGRSKPV
eukprot:CAMPEP_0185034712 /NCGR_PEP_ID=MMETSP1103-20130426/24826_1 /TAXON_ID=36769 /ORGANISM="Paraphysomonas bandaiensis, Strain Caron Lab Isolate" /LENGTH=316 /DNA_ID=CAMNT_0027571477 /DNA_START=140 /DNA_END=1090 /DNA_ORIENTATION=+